MLCKNHGLDRLATDLVYCLSYDSKLKQNEGRGAKKKYCSMECKGKWGKETFRVN